MLKHVKVLDFIICGCILYTKIFQNGYFRISLFTILLKLSVRNRCWNNLRNTDNVTYKAAIQYQRCLNKTRKCQLDLEFLYKCKKNKVNPKFVRWKNIS